MPTKNSLTAYSDKSENDISDKSGRRHRNHAADADVRTRRASRTSRMDTLNSRLAQHFHTVVSSSASAGPEACGPGRMQDDYGAWSAISSPGLSGARTMRAIFLPPSWKAHHFEPSPPPAQHGHFFFLHWWERGAGRCEQQESYNTHTTNTRPTPQQPSFRRLDGYDGGKSQCNSPHSCPGLSLSLTHTHISIATRPHRRAPNSSLCGCGSAGRAGWRAEWVVGAADSDWAPGPAPAVFRQSKPQDGRCSGAQGGRRPGLVSFHDASLGSTSCPPSSPPPPLTYHPLVADCQACL